MTVSYELQLMAIAISLYIFDSSLLLYPHEGVLFLGPKGTWRSTPRGEEFLVMGRSLCVLNLFAPHRPVFRLVWRFDDPTVELVTTGWSDLASSLRSIAPFTVGAGVAWYVLLPLGLFTRLGTPFVLTAVALLYSHIILALCWLFVQRSTYQLRGTKFAALAFECIACPPFAVNLVRRVSLAQSICEPFPEAARRLLDSDAWAEVRAKCVERIAYEIEGEQEGSPRRELLRVQQQRLQSYELPA